MKNWILYVLVGGGIAVYNVAMEADRDGSGAIVDAGNVGAFDLRVGDCFDDASYSFDGNDQITSLPGVPCSDPHDNEVYAVFDVSLDSYPDDEGMWELAMDRCLDRFQPFVGRDYETSSLDILTMYPTPESWEIDNDREVVCAVFDIDANKLVGGVQGKAL